MSEKSVRLHPSDHRKIGQRLDLFKIDARIGKGLPLWLPNGTIVRDELEKLAKELEFRAGYQRVATPHIARTELYYRSGHLPYFREDMYPFMDVVEEDGIGHAAFYGPKIAIVGHRQRQQASVTLRRYGIDEQLNLDLDEFERLLQKTVQTRSRQFCLTGQAAVKSETSAGTD